MVFELVKPRVIETEEGIQEEFDVLMYEKMMRRFRDKGWIETDSIIKSGINAGLALEIGPGPGYLGLEWLKKTEGTELRALEISREMKKLAEGNAREYGLQSRVKYVLGDAQDMPFDDATFDGVFTNGSLHEWAEPMNILNEIDRMLKPGGRYFISDLRRDMSPPVMWFIRAMTKPREMRSGLATSINAAYTAKEVASMLEESELSGYEVRKTIIGLAVEGKK